MVKLVDAPPSSDRISQTSSGRPLKSSTNSSMFDALVSASSQLNIRHLKGAQILDRIVTATVVLNTIVLGLNIEFQSDPWDLIWQIAGFIFTGVFTIEMVIKLNSNKHGELTSLRE